MASDLSLPSMKGKEYVIYQPAILALPSQVPLVHNELASGVREDSASPLPSPSSVSRQTPAVPPVSSTDLSLVPYSASLPGQLPVPSSAKSALNGSLDGVTAGEVDVAEDKKRDRENKKRKKNWSMPETLLLIRLRTDLAPRFGTIGRKRYLWDEIAKGLQREHFARDAQQCMYRWEKLMVRYNAVREGRKDKRDNPYFDHLHLFLSEKALRRDREREISRHENELEVGFQLVSTDLRSDLSLDRAFNDAGKELVPRAYPRKEGLLAAGDRGTESSPFRHDNELAVGTRQLAASHFSRDLNQDGSAKDAEKDGVTRAYPRKEGFGAGEDKEKEDDPFRREKKLETGAHQAAFDLRRDYLDVAMKDADKQGAPRPCPRKEGFGTGVENGGEESSPLRKRKRGPKFVALTEVHAVQTLLDTVISRQQRFFMDLLEAMERKEQFRERMRQEREEEWRAEERAQRCIFNNAMIVLTQKLVAERIGSTAPGLSGTFGGRNVGRDGQEKCLKNWKRADVLQLIKLRGEMESKFVKSTRKAAVWEELAELLVAQGIQREGKQCREKWDKMMSQYKEVLDGKREQVDCHYFTELTAIVGERPGGEAC